MFEFRMLCLRYSKFEHGDSIKFSVCLGMLLYLAELSRKSDMATNEFSFGVGLSQQPRFTVYDDDGLQSLQVKKNAKRTEQSTTYGGNTLKKFLRGNENS